MTYRADERYEYLESGQDYSVCRERHTVMWQHDKDQVEPDEQQDSRELSLVL